MKKKKNKRNKKLTNTLTISKEQVWQAKKPRYNGFACGYGVHGKTKYDRAQDKKFLRQELDNFKTE